MKRLAVIALGLAFVAFGFLPAAKADSLQSVLFNINGATQTTFAGFNTAGFNQTTGIGTLTFTFSPGAAGSYSFSSFFDNSLNLPFYNEFGAANGAPVGGQTWEIGDSFASSIYNDVFAGGALSNMNNLPGQLDNYLLTCTGATCNGDAAMAMAFAFTLAANQAEVITLTFSETQPTSGFYLQQTHPIDPANGSVLNLYFTGSATTEQVIKGVPEPGTLTLLGAGVFVFALKRRR